VCQDHLTGTEHVHYAANDAYGDCKTWLIHVDTTNIGVATSTRVAIGSPNSNVERNITRAQRYCTNTKQVAGPRELIHSV